MSVDPTTFEPDRIARLKQLLGSDFPALAESFRATMRQSLSALDEARSAGRLQEARDIAHRMRSTASQFGLMGVAAAAECFERHEKPEESASLAMAVGRAYANSHALLETALADLS